MSLNTSNVFAALNTKASKSKGSGKDGKNDKSDSGGKKLSKKAQRVADVEAKAKLEASLFGGSAPSAGVSNWADELDDEDDFETAGNAILAPLPDDWALGVKLPYCTLCPAYSQRRQALLMQHS
jgi:hypothetical protein